jgi:hypothetical protein
MTIKKKSLDFEISGDRETTFERTTPKLIHWMQNCFFFSCYFSCYRYLNSYTDFLHFPRLKWSEWCNHITIRMNLDITGKLGLHSFCQLKNRTKLFLMTCDDDLWCRLVSNKWTNSHEMSKESRMPWKHPLHRRHSLRQTLWLWYSLHPRRRLLHHDESKLHSLVSLSCESRVHRNCEQCRLLYLPKRIHSRCQWTL